MSGFSRGGTNILWNLICSHPGVLTTGIELNEIFGPSRTNISMFWKSMIEGCAISGLPVPEFVADYSEHRITSFAEEHAKNSWGRWKSPEEAYVDDEISRLPICTKSVNSWARDPLFALMKRNIALKYNNLLLRSFGRVRTIYLIRDSESQCNGWMRRGCDPYEAGKWYHQIVDTMLKDHASRPDDVLFVKFHDLLFNTLPTLNNVYEFLGLDKQELVHYHLKLKKVLKKDGSHEVLSGTEGDMVWISEKDLGTFLDSGVDARQRGDLSATAKGEFKRGLGNIADRLDEVLAC
ncbi:MAG: sulfotransferase [Gammaproteobacteria bacterium]|nr:sulfotransferase [Gammaproteobacteria bacterium]